MRVTGGELTGRRLAVPTGARPTTDRVREAVFNSLGHVVSWPECDVLDLFAGSGALGIEALSRGCRSATFVERDRAAVKVLRENLAVLGVAGRAVVVAADAHRWTPAAGARFSLALADPPYEVPGSDVARLIGGLGARGALTDGAAIVVERPVRDPVPPFPEHWETRRRRYGDTLVWYGRAEHVNPGETSW